MRKLNEQWQDELSHAEDNENLILKLDNVQKELQKLKRLVSKEILIRVV